MRRDRQVAGAIHAGALAGALLTLTACDRPETPAHLRIAGGDAERGSRLIQRYRCGACHRIEGIRGGNGIVGPPLTDYAQRVLLAGVVPNAPRTLVPWLIDPPAMAPNTAMPNLGITEREARDIATYLYTLGAEKVRAWPPDALPVRAAGGREQPLHGPIPIEAAMERVIKQGESR
jgi:mono/diheme cytochrome c family protein